MEQQAEAPVNWTVLVHGIRDNDDGAMEQLYEIFGQGVRSYLYRQVGPQELEDKVHDVFLIVVQAIRRGDLREPERLMGFVRTIAHRRVAAYIGDVVRERREEIPLDVTSSAQDAASSPEDTVIDQQQLEMAANILRSMSSRDRDILTRFYVLEQPREQICAEMKLTDTQFRLLKSRAKARFADRGRARMRVSKSSMFGRIFPRFRH